MIIKFIYAIIASILCLVEMYRAIQRMRSGYEHAEDVEMILNFSWFIILILTMGNILVPAINNII